MNNLRQVGCPEQTVRDIITADVHSTYASRAARLEQRRNGPNSFAPTIDMELSRMRKEEEAVLDSLFGRNASAVEEQQKEELPLVFQSVDPARIKLDETQMETLNQLQQRFREEIGGANQDPTSPEYRERWEIAQRQNDELLGGLLGGEFFVDYQLAVTNGAPSN